LEARLGWAHRGIQAGLRGQAPAAATRLAARIDGAASAAHAAAFARAVEAASGFEPPPAACALRTLMLALERIAVRLHDLHATADALGTPWHRVAGARERLLGACEAAFGHRLLFDAICPGGVAAEPGTAALAGLDRTLAAMPPLRRDWPATGTLPIEAALAFGVPGPAGRAAGRPDPADPGAKLRSAGDLAARMALVAEAFEADCEAARTVLANVPAGPLCASLPLRDAEGLGVAEGPLGPVWHWMRLAGGHIEASFAAAPQWLLLPALERAAIGLGYDHLPAHLASFGFRPTGMDL
jgi:Ni,Fe-hydrogenase III large subunit